MSKFRALFGTNELRSTSAEYYEWKILQNPYGQGNIYLERADGVVAGSATLTPKKVSMWGDEILAAEIGDTFTRPEFRRRGIFSRGVRACTQFGISRNIKLIYGTPNSQSLPGYQSKLDYPPCPFITLSYLTKHRQTLVPLMRSTAKLVLRGKLSPPDVPPSTILRQTFSRTARSRPGAPRRDESFEIVAADTVPDDINGLWGTPRYIFCTVRDKTYLEWRYFKHPDTYQVLLCKEGDAYLGYVVTKVSNSRKLGTICDFLTRDDRVDVFRALIGEAENVLADAGVHLIQLRCVAGSPYHQALLGHGYHDHGSGGWQPVIIYAGSEYGRTLLETDARWHFTLSDSDNI